MKKIEFHKYHCLGNDFLIVDRIGKQKLTVNLNRLTQKICDRNRGVGGDGLLLLGKSRQYGCFLDLYNSDGSWAEKSGNGLRITAAYLASNYKSGRKVEIETKVGLAEARIIRSGKTKSTIKVSLGQPNFRTADIPMKVRPEFHINQPITIDKYDFILTGVSIGNPHAVIFVDNFEFDWKFLGSVIENCRFFPNRTNVEFVKIVNRSKLILNDWERGAGATGSSGTGAGAAVAAGIINGYLERRVEVVFPSGSMFIEWPSNDENMYLTGAVEFVCDGLFILA